tara:strand:- start:130 stop:903 length:774 start_codon:yes stop_codon:yes gene_type:complete
MPKEDILKTAIVTPDKHFPLHDKKAINIVCQAIEIVKPNIYIDLGDTGEWEHFSTHYWKGRNAKPMEDLMPLLDFDVKSVNAGMDWIDESLDKVNTKERHFVQGNHEVWLDKFVTRHPYLTQYKTKNALKLVERGYKFHPYNRKKCLKIGKLNFTHGKYTTKYHSQKHLEHYGESIMYGHTHDLQRHTATKAGGTISSWSLGCLKDIKADEDWLGGRLTNWNHAFAIVNWFKGGNFTVEVVEIINGQASLWGKVING